MNIKGDITENNMKGERKLSSIMTVRAPDKLQRELKKIAEEQGFTRNALILQILREWVNKQNTTN